MTKLFAAVRLARLMLRSSVYRAYLRLAHPGVRCHPSVRFGRGAIVQAFAGGRADIGAGTRIDDGAFVRVEGGRLTIGQDCLIGRGAVVVCVAELEIGRGTLIAEHVTIRDQDHRHQGNDALDRQGIISSPIRIGHDVWIGAKVTVTRGVSIAPHAVVAANAVVTRSLDERAVYGGIPARRLK